VCSAACTCWATARAWPMAARVCQKYSPVRNLKLEGLVAGGDHLRTARTSRTVRRWALRPWLWVNGIYSVNTMRETRGKGTVYTRHQSETKAREQLTVEAVGDVFVPIVALEGGAWGWEASMGPGPGGPPRKRGVLAARISSHRRRIRHDSGSHETIPQPALYGDCAAPAYMDHTRPGQRRARPSKRQVGQAGKVQGVDDALCIVGYELLQRGVTPRGSAQSGNLAEQQPRQDIDLDLRRRSPVSRKESRHSFCLPDIAPRQASSFGLVAEWDGGRLMVHAAPVLRENGRP